MGIRANYGSMSETSADLANVANGLQERLEGLSARVRQVSEQWNGEAQQAFAIQEKKLEDAMSNLSSVEKQTANQVQNAGFSYGATDSRLAGRYLNL